VLKKISNFVFEVYMLKKYDIVVSGGVCGYEAFIAESLTRHGLYVRLLLPSTEQIDSYQSTNPFGDFVRPSLLHDALRYDSPASFFAKAMRGRLLLNINIGAVSALRYLYPLKFCPGFPPVINLATGSDITEYARQASLRGRLYQHHLKTSRINWFSPYPEVLKSVFDLSIPRVVIMAQPLYITAELPDTDANDGVEPIFFHPSHLDWKVCDAGIHRNSTKGNDRFLRAFIRAKKNGLPGKCLILERGPDLGEAHKIINDANANDFFIWKAAMTHSELLNNFSRCTVVVDQFDVGGLGLIATEAMSCERPVITYVHEETSRILYGGDMPPVLNCSSEDEIYAVLWRTIDKHLLKSIGRESRAWLLRNHAWETCLSQFLFHYAHLTGESFPPNQQNSSWIGS